MRTHPGPASVRRALVALILIAVAGAQASGVRAATAGSPLDSLAWMSGRWSSDDDGSSSEEHWTTAEGGLMVGMNRTLKDGRAVAFEFLRIVARGDTVIYVAMPDGRDGTEFPLKERSGRRVVFENPTHDFPQRIIYWQEGADDLHVRIEGAVNGDLRGHEWVWRRAGPVR